MPRRAAAALALRNVRLFQVRHTRRSEHLDGERELALLARRDRSDADDLARYFFAPIVGDRYHHRVLPCLPRVRMANRSFHAKRGKGGDDCAPIRTCKPHVLSARRTDARALQNHRPAVRAGTRRASWSPSYGGHDAWRAPNVSEDFVGVGSWSRSSPQPSSTRPRIREPAATLSVPASRSPVCTPAARISPLVRFSS